MSRFITSLIRSSVESVVLKTPKLYTDNIFHLLQTSLFRDKGDGRGKAMEQIYSNKPNPLLQPLVDTPNDFYGTYSDKDSKPTIWIVVPFQSTGKDGREEHKTEFIERMRLVRDSLIDRFNLRIRFCRQVFSCYRRTESHPISEKPFYDDPAIYTPKFNRGILLNSGLSTIQSAYAIYTHDVDLVPGNETSYMAYSTEINDDTVLHLAGGWDRYNREGTEGKYLGGIAGMTLEGWRLVDGYPNDYFGWGGEDDEYLRRIKERGVRIDAEFYDKSKFLVEDLEKIDDVATKRKIVGTKEADNVVKNELMELYRTGKRTGGISTVSELTRIIGYTQSGTDDWVDILDIVVLPEAYTRLEPSSYEKITLVDSRKDIYRESLYAYKMLNASDKDWSKSDVRMDETETAYYNMRLPIEVYDETNPDPPDVKRYRERFIKLPRYKLLKMDLVGSYSISYPETGDQMAIIMASILGTSAGVIDGTACLGGNTGFLARYFEKVTAIEINPYRARLVVDNLQRVFLNGYPQVDSVRIAKNVVEVCSPEYPPKAISVLDGDTQEVLLPRITDSQLLKCRPLGRALFVDPPWGGPGYGYAARKIGLEMTSHRNGQVTAAQFLLPIIRRAIRERAVVGQQAGILSQLEYVFMKVPENYDEAELQATLAGYATVMPKILIPDRTMRNRVYLIIMRVMPPLMGEIS